MPTGLWLLVADFAMSYQWRCSMAHSHFCTRMCIRCEKHLDIFRRGGFTSGSTHRANLLFDKRHAQRWLQLQEEKLLGRHLPGRYCCWRQAPNLIGEDEVVLNYGIWQIVLGCAAIVGFWLVFAAGHEVNSTKASRQTTAVSLLHRTVSFVGRRPLSRLSQVWELLVSFSCLHRKPHHRYAVDYSHAENRSLVSCISSQTWLIYNRCSLLTTMPIFSRIRNIFIWPWQLLL